MAEEELKTLKRKSFEHPQWEEEYFFVGTQSGPQCLICNATLSSWKKYNVKRHFQLLHEKDIVSLNDEERKAKLSELKQKKEKDVSILADNYVIDSNYCCY